LPEELHTVDSIHGVLLAFLATSPATAASRAVGRA